VAGAQEPDKKASDVTRLVLKAIQALPEDEQRAVLEYFVERGIGGTQSPVLGRFIGPAQSSWAPAEHRLWPALATLFTAQKSMGPEQITIPVRLSEAQHQRLKHWSAEHNFPMAVVVRGLIERFLDSWDERTS